MENMKYMVTYQRWNDTHLGTQMVFNDKNNAMHVFHAIKDIAVSSTENIRFVMIESFDKYTRTLISKVSY